jgi:FtsZ-binding cell division protein ZapB
MPDKLTDSEIVKALKCCILNDCSRNCPLYYTTLSYRQCREATRKNALDLINRLQAENERLKEEKSKLENKIDEIYPLVMQLPNAMKQAKAEAYKECIEKAKDLFPKEDWFTREAFDNLLNELVGEQPISNDVKCKDCEYLELELPYAVCSKAYKGIVAPDDSCGKGKLKETVGDDDAKEKE